MPIKITPAHSIEGGRVNKIYGDRSKFDCTFYVHDIFPTIVLLQLIHYSVI